MSSISFHIDTTTSISHNNRINIFGNKDINLNKLESNIYYIQKDIREIYKSEFDEVVKEYNFKQKRNDRKIDDYYKKIFNDKKTEHQRELIVAIGSKDENISNKIIDKKADILDEYMKNFQERNPNLKVYNAVMHLDESNPHLHINYIPVAHYNKGLKKRVSQENSLKEQGLTFEQWRIRETNLIDNLMHSKGIERHFVGSHKHMSVKEYKEIKKEIQELNLIKKGLEESIKYSTNILNEIKTYSKYIGAGNLNGTKVRVLGSDYDELEKGSIYYTNDFYEILDDLNEISIIKNENYNIEIDVFDDKSCDTSINLISNFKFRFGVKKDFCLKDEVLKKLNPLMKNRIEKIKNYQIGI